MPKNTPHIIMNKIKVNKTYLGASEYLFFSSLRFLIKKNIEKPEGEKKNNINKRH